MQGCKTYIIMVLYLAIGFLSGCRSPQDHRIKADKVAYDIIEQKQKEALGESKGFSIERPSDILRRRLLVDQNLPHSSETSLGADRLKPIEHWPEKGYPVDGDKAEPNMVIPAGEPLTLSLTQALQVAARNSFEYQAKKEEIFRTALDLDLERDAFRDTFYSQLEYLVSTDSSGNRTVSGTEAGGAAGWSRKLASGAELSSALAVDLANLLTMGGASSVGLAADASVSIPLLRGSGSHIVTESLTQAERNVIYAIYGFERFKRTFAVSVAREYLSVLRQMDEVGNAEENYSSSITSARRSRRLAEAGRLSEIQLDQAVQNELRARNRWISAQEQFKNRLDAFKTSLGLPPDAWIELDRQDLEQMRVPALKLVDKISREAKSESQIHQPTPPADAPVEMVPPSAEDAGPWEIDESLAVRLALEKRMDLRTAMDSVYDSQRRVVIAADALGAELTLLGTADLGGRRSVGSAGVDDAQLRFDKGRYAGLLTLDLPLERTAERNNYRKSLINLEKAVRDVQILEDEIKLSIRNELRTLLESRESLNIQAQSVVVAQKRVRSSNLFLEAGKAEIRDLLEAQDALLSAQNSLTAAVIGYRVAELELQRDVGLLEVDAQGLWREFSPEEIKHGKK